MHRIVHRKFNCYAFYIQKIKYLYFCKINSFLNNCFTPLEIRVSKWTEFTKVFLLGIRNYVPHQFLLIAPKVLRTVLVSLLMYLQTAAGLKRTTQHFCL